MKLNKLGLSEGIQSLFVKWSWYWKMKGLLVMDVIGFLVVTIFIIGVSYSLVFQIQQLLTVKHNDKTPQYRRLMFAHYLTCFSIVGFLVSFILNVLVYLQFIYSQLVTSNSTNISCLIFFLMLFTSKFVITPRTNWRYTVIPSKKITNLIR